MPRIVEFLLLALLAPGFGFAMRAQILPVPAIPPASTGPALAAGLPGAGPMAVIRGWSSSDEIRAEVVTTVPKTIVLDANAPGIVFFFATGPASSRLREFRYQMVGYDPDWTVTRSTLAHYRRLRPGRFRLELQARETDGAWGPVTQLAVTQRSFFFETWYFYVLFAFGLVMLLGQLLTQRDQLLKGQIGIVLEERNRIASDCHDTLMAGFAAISWQLEATAKLFRDAGIAETPTATSCELARSMVAHCQAEARRIIWDLRDTEELTDILSQGLARAIAAYPVRESIATTFEVRGQEIPIAPGAVHHLVCIGQEAVTNAVRHASPTQIHVTLSYEADALSLAIRDDGTGFQVADSATRTGHFGIPVMQERARKLGGTLRLTSSAQGGTEVTITLGFQAIDRDAKRQQTVVPWIGV